MQFFKRPVRILIYEKPAWLWMFVSFGIYGFAVLVYFTLGFIKEHEFLFSLYILGALVCEILFPILFYILVRAMISSLSHFTIFTLVIAAFSFAIHAYRIPGLRQLFPPFTIRTQIELWVCFAGLAVATFHNKLPEVFRLAVQPVLVAGTILCLLFAVSLLIPMLFAWLFFWAGGLGLLVYSPIFALIAFVSSVRRIHNSVTKKRISTWLIGGTIAIILSYSILYKVQWDRAEKFVQEEDLRIQKLDEQERSAGRGGISSSDARYIEYRRNAATFSWWLNGKYQCKRVSLSEEICPFVNSILSVEECVRDHGCHDSIFPRLAD
ncbi:hypothetical protein [Leptospira santarosai]|uniref:hypothetical protein n=2 Tax=Leptospira santarosai TaxID=28183 RepID=UPI000774146B|nr:hypothetical protein [Leptospira santarosai]